MHERTERAISRLLFMFCCAVPTLITLLVILVTWTPWYHHRQIRLMEKARESETGLIVEIQDFDRITPQKWELQDVSLTQPETNHEVAWIRHITWLKQDKVVRALLHQPKVQAAQLASTWKLIHDRFLCRPEHTDVPLELSANDLTLHSSDGDVTLRDVDVRVESKADQVIATIQCLPAWAPTGSPILITITRNRGVSPNTQWILETGNTALPCSAVSDYFPALKRLGPDAEFLGVMKWELLEGGSWSVDFTGSRFTNVELSRLFQDLPHRLTGTAEFQLDRCIIYPGELVNISGTFIAYEGWIGQSLLAAMQTHLGFEVFAPEFTAGSATDLPFGRCAIHFRIADSQLLLEGVCGNLRGFSYVPGIALCNNRQAIAKTPGIAIPASNLMRVLAPTNVGVVPVTQQTRSLMNLMVAPDGRSQMVERDAVPGIKIHTARPWSGNEPVRQR